MLIGIKVQCTLVQVQIHEIKKNIDTGKAMQTKRCRCGGRSLLKIIQQS
jgi:hypothetical protein